MGMFLSKYSMLHALGYGDDSYVLNETKKILSKYKLLGLIIHDPETHKEFHNKLAEIFERLNYITGEDFLFFCITDPPKRLKEKENRDFHGIWDTDNPLSPSNAYKTKDESITAYSLCQALGLDYEDLPLIILTNNFQFDRFRYIRTNSDYVENQLSEIGFFCSQKHNYFNLINDPELLDLIRTIDSCGGNDIVNNQEPIAKTLTDFLSFIVSNNRFRDNRDGLSHVKNVLTSFQKSESKMLPQNNNMPEFKSKAFFSKFLTNRRSEKPTPRLPEKFETDSIAYVKMEKKNLFLLGGISNLINSLTDIYERDNAFFINPRNIKEDSSFNITIHNGLLEDESKIVLKTFNTVYPNFQTLVINQGLQLDFSPLITSLCKIFEIEINLSLVHWIRAKLNIEMPTYYKKVKPGNGTFSMLPSNELIINPRPVNFNAGKMDRWKAPGIGESELICKTLHFQNQFPDHLISDYDKFIHCWSVMRNYRNMAAHTEAMNQQQFLETKKAFSDFNISGYFDQLTNIKLHLKSK